MKFKILAFLVSFAVGTLVWQPFRPAPPVQHHVLAIPDRFPPPSKPDFHELEGLVSGQLATLHLNVDGKRLFGNYSIHDSGVSIPVRGVVDDDNCVLLVEYAEAGDRPTGWFPGEMVQDPIDFKLRLVGSWSRSQNGNDPGTFQFEEDRLFRYPTFR